MAVSPIFKGEDFQKLSGHDDGANQDDGTATLPSPVAK